MFSVDDNHSSCCPRSSINCNDPMPSASIAKPNASSRTRLAFFVSPRNSVSPKKASTPTGRSEEHTSELRSLMRISYAVFCLKKNKTHQTNKQPNQHTQDTQSNTNTQHK